MIQRIEGSGIITLDCSAPIDFIERNECIPKQEYFHMLSLSWNEIELRLMVRIMPF